MNFIVGCKLFKTFFKRLRFNVECHGRKPSSIYILNNSFINLQLSWEKYFGNLNLKSDLREFNQKLKGKFWGIKIFTRKHIFYKEINTHNYVNYKSHYLNHIKWNIPFNLVIRILVFVSRDWQRPKLTRYTVFWRLEFGFPN